MNKIILATIVLTLVSCSSSPFKESTKRQDMVNEHLSQGVKFLEGNFDDKYSKTGKTGVYIVAVGNAIHPIQSNQKMVESAAIADAKFRLTESAPSEFKKVVQQAVGTEIGGVGEFSQVDVSVSEVKNLTGIKVKFEDVQCRTRVEPQADGKYKTMKECRALARVKESDLKAAYDFTIASKYGVSKRTIANKLED